MLTLFARVHCAMNGYRYRELLAYPDCDTITDDSIATFSSARGSADEAREFGKRAAAGPRNKRVSR
jgi:hypothetical protein